MSAVSNVIETVSRQLPELELRRDEPMRNHTSFRIGGPAEVLYLPKSQDELITLCRIVYDCGVRPLIIGNGSNLLVDDARLDIVVIKTNGGFGNVRLTGEAELTAESGVLLSQLAVFALEHGLTGLEFAHGIPGTLGGALKMNAGAYGGEIGQMVTETVTLKPDGSLNITIGLEHEFSYRHSRFSNSEEVLISSVLKLSKAHPAAIKETMTELSKKRRESQPLNMPSAGSTFKRPKNGYTAALIDQAGLKGYTVGDALVSEKHAGFIVNKGNATFTDVRAVMAHIQETVYKQFGVTLEPEVKILRASGMFEQRGIE